MSLWKLLTARWGSGSGETDDVRIDGATNSLQTIEYAHHEIHDGHHFYLVGHATLGNADSLHVKLVTPDTTKWGHFIWEINSSGIMTAVDLTEDATGGMAGGARPTIHANNRNVGCWTGSHTAAGNHATIMTDSAASFTVDALIGKQIFNSTDGSSGIITDNDATTVTVAALAGGTDNDWDTSDTYEINDSAFVITSGVTACTGYTQQVDNTAFGSRTGGLVAREDELILKQNTVYCRTFTSGAASNILNFKASWYEHTNKH